MYRDDDDSQSSDQSELESNRNNESVMTMDSSKERDQLNSDEYKLTEKLLIQFYRQKLVKPRIHKLQENNQLHLKIKAVIEPYPSLYFTPIIILTEKSIDAVENQIINSKQYRKIYSWDNTNNKQIIIKKHSDKQIHYYRITQSQYNSPVNFATDSYSMVDHIYEGYCRKYSKMYFQQTGGLFLYWLYSKGLLDLLSLACAKILIITAFVLMGNGVRNLLQFYKQQQPDFKSLKYVKRMVSTDFYGVMKLSPKLQNIKNYCTEQINGFYKPYPVQRCSKIHRIYPLYFPLSWIRDNTDKNIHFTNKQLNDTLQNIKVQGLFYLIYRLFKMTNLFLNKKCTIDLKKSKIYDYDHSSKVCDLKVMHPVLDICLSPKINQRHANRLRTAVDNVYQGAKNILDSKEKPFHLTKIMFGF